MRRTTRGVVALGGALVAAGVLAAPAGAHVAPDKSEVPAGAYTSVALTVGHGCGESPTTQVRVQVPEGIDDVTPAVLPGWDIEVATEALPEAKEGAHGEEVTERESEVTFTAQTGNELADGYRQSFTLGFKAPDTPGEHLFFKTIQTCVEGETPWIEEYTGEGEEPESPSPVVLVTEASGDGHGSSSEGDDAPVAEEASGDLAATPVAASGSDDDGGSDGLAIAGIVLGGLGLLAGGAALLRGRPTTG